jgi:hypothetical protein
VTTKNVPRPRRVPVVAFVRGDGALCYIDAEGVTKLDAMVKHVQASWNEMYKGTGTMVVGQSRKEARQAFADGKLESRAGLTQTMVDRFWQEEDGEGQVAEPLYFSKLGQHFHALGSTNANGRVVPSLWIGNLGVYDAIWIATAWQVVSAFLSLLKTAQNNLNRQFPGTEFVGYRFVPGTHFVGNRVVPPDAELEVVVDVPPKKAEKLEDALETNKVARRLPTSVPLRVLRERPEIIEYATPEYE